MSKASERRRAAWDALPDLATPRERRWLDLYARLAMWTTDGSKYKILRRTGPGDGEFQEIRCFIDRPKAICVLIERDETQSNLMNRTRNRLLDLPGVISRVRRLRRQEREYNRRKAEREQGAYI